jgi:hypothetical protein
MQNVNYGKMYETEVRYLGFRMSEQFDVFMGEFAQITDMVALSKKETDNKIVK